MTDKSKGGRPSKYRPEFCQEIINFFDVEHTTMKTFQSFRKDGSVVTITREVANQLPTFERFAVNCGVHTDTLVEWTKVHEEFSVAYKTAKHLQKEMLNDLALRGFYNPTYTQFVAKNITDMKDKTEQEVVTKTVYITPEEKEEYEKHIDEIVNKK